VLYDLDQKHVKMGCTSKESVGGGLESFSCLSHFAATVAGGFCEFCCTSQSCNVDWTLARVKDECVKLSAAATVQRWPLIATGALITAVHALLRR